MIRILIVDDIAESRLLLSQILIPIVFLVREADNGQDAIKLWRQWQPHLILMDIWKTAKQQEENLETFPKIMGDIDVLNLLYEMPTEWIQKLYEASSECSDDMVLKLTDKIPEDQTILAHILRNLAENFQFGKLMKLAQGELE